MHLSLDKRQKTRPGRRTWHKPWSELKTPMEDAAMDIIQFLAGASMDLPLCIQIIFRRAQVKDFLRTDSFLCCTSLRHAFLSVCDCKWGIYLFFITPVQLMQVSYLNSVSWVSRTEEWRWLLMHFFSIPPWAQKRMIYSLYREAFAEHGQCVLFLQGLDTGLLMETI